MKEFGSDFHTISCFYNTEINETACVYPSATYLADGRQCLILAIRQERWRRLWVPEYFCYEVLDTLVKYTGVELAFYIDYPSLDSHVLLKQLPFRKGDALLKMNYFGLCDSSLKESIPIPIIEDHSHDLLSRSALYSNADWCIASLRKTLPLAEGGILWSPRGKTISEEFKLSFANEKLATNRWEAMDMKAKYLSDFKGDLANIKLKEAFRQLFEETELALSDLEISALDKRSTDTLSQFDINAWYGQKRKNWSHLTKSLDDKLNYLRPMNESCTPFSLILKTQSKLMREKLRIGLIQNAVYPAVLWNVPETCSKEVRFMSDCLLSVHCDGRYSESDMEELACVINKVYNNI